MIVTSFFALNTLFCALLVPQPPPAAKKNIPRELTLSQGVEAGVPMIHLRNEYRAAATAWVVGCEGESATLWHSTNQNLSLAGKALGPGQETTFRIPSPPSLAASGKAPCEDFRVVAAVFGDGTVTGDLRWISALVAETRQVYEDIAKATDLLKKVSGGGADGQAEVTKQLTEWYQTGLPQGMPAQPGPGSAVMYGASPSRGGAVPMAPPPLRRTLGSVVPGAALWLLQKQGADEAGSIRALAEWRERIGPVGRLAAELPNGSNSMAGGSVRRTGSGGGQMPIMPPGALVGKPAPAFALKDVDGQEVKLSELRGKTVFVTFWATWCAPCRVEMPQIQALHEEFGEKGLVVLAINNGEPAETAGKYFRDEKYTFRSLVDQASGTHEKYGGGGIPKVVLIDKDGIVRYHQVGYSSRQDFRGEVKKLGL